MASAEKTLARIYNIARGVVPPRYLKSEAKKSKSGGRITKKKKSGGTVTKKKKKLVGKKSGGRVAKKKKK